MTRQAQPVACRGSAAPRRTALAALLLAVLPAGCVYETPWRRWAPRMQAPGRYEVVRDQLVVRSDFPLATHHRMVEDLIGRRQDLSRELELPLSDEPINIYLFDSAEAFASFIRLYFPALPQRRAYFIETDTQLTVYAQWGQRVAEDLRHEVTHGYLHSVIPRLPLWLDEGLAEYFETPRGQNGLNAEHLAWMRPRVHEGQWRPDLWRLEQIEPAATMTGDDYAEAWGWVHFLLHSRPENRRTLQTYLADLRRDGQTESLSARLRRLGDPVPPFLEHARQWFLHRPRPATGGAGPPAGL